MKVALDTSVIVELLSHDTSRQEITSLCYKRHRAAQDEFVVADRALIEAFSVLSRMPKRVGLPAAEAERLLIEHFGVSAISSLPQGFCWGVIRHTLERGYWGGRVHDAEIAMASYEAGARLLLTWNLRDFLTVAPVGLEIRTPA
jgi:predicted nucleic acid-binding protein